MTNFKFDIQRFARQADQSVHSGNTVLLKVNGQIVGRAQSLDGRRSFGTEGVYEIGSIMPQEHINNRYEGTVQLERFLIKTADLAKVGMAALGEEILTRDVIDIEVVDKATGKAVRVYRGCTAVDYSENFRVGAISGENASFQYLSCDDGTTDGIDAVIEMNNANSSSQTYTNMANATARNRNNVAVSTTTSGYLSSYDSAYAGSGANPSSLFEDVGTANNATLPGGNG